MKIMKTILVICLGILLATVFAGLLRLGEEFNFGGFKFEHWVIFVVYYTAAISGALTYTKSWRNVKS